EETVHLDTADKLFVEMIKSAQVQPVQPVANIADRGNVETDGFLRHTGTRQKYNHQAGSSKWFQV
ncbi:MAG TPA: hypothetical protein PK806_09145, partial [Saprospiraceae bacterium]|nr:hypothetical protein [Saprospiraceae bacterium]